MNKNLLLTTLTASVLLSACASQTGWRPTVDPYNDRNAHRIEQDLQECKQLASQASGGLGKEVATGAIVGGALGAAAGAATGAFVGDAGHGAAVGASIGGASGAAKQGFESEDNYKNAYKNCMRQRGHNVLN